MKPDSKFLPMTYGFLGAASFWMLAHSGPAVAQLSGAVPAFLKLQATTPGTQQTGNANISGTAIAGQFIGGGAGLVNVNATLLDGLDSTAFLQGVPNPLNLTSANAASVISGTNSNTLSGAAGIKGVSSAASGTTQGIWGLNSSPSGRGVFGETTSPTGTNYGGRFETNSTSGRGVYGFAIPNTGNTYGVFGQSNSSTGRGVYGYAAANTGENYGGYFTTDSTTGYGIFAASEGPYGVFAESNLSAGQSYGGRFRASSTAGIGVSGAALATSGNAMGGRFESNSTSGKGVFGYAAASSGTTYGVWGKTESPSGRAIYGDAAGTGTAGYFQSDSGEAIHAESDGLATATFISTYTGINPATAVSAIGDYMGGDFVGEVYGLQARGSIGVQASGTGTEGVGLSGYGAGTDGHGVMGSGATGVAGFSSSYRGVWGDAFDNSGGTAYGIYGEARSNPGRGVYGLASNASGTGYGVRGVNSASAGYGVYAVGDSGASGNKSFVIDHPFDPLNKYLKHYSAEGPEPKNIYDGTVVTDSKGWATVQLPDYFTSINKDPRVQLTVSDSSEDFIMVKVVGGVNGNTFRIRTSKGGAKVYWEVKATRNDLWNQAHGAPVEVLKDAAEKGKYQHPELYGQPKEMAIDYDVRAANSASRNKRR